MKIHVKYLGICLLALCLCALCYQCEDDELVSGVHITPVGDLPTVTTLNVSNITSSSATCRGNVTNDGGLTVTSRGICWSISQNPTIDNSHVISSGSGTGSFTSTLTGLSANTTYYVRAYATNSRGTSYGGQKSFKTDGNNNTQYHSWIYYDNGTFDDSWGFTNGGDVEWAVMFPTSYLSQFNNITVDKIQAYFDMIGTYTLKVYSGNYYSPNTTLMTKSISVSSSGWKTISFSAVPVSNSQCLWVSLSKPHQAGEYPMCASTGVNASNARWYRLNGSEWYDFIDCNGGQDVSWMIRAYISYYNNKSERVEEVELPQIQHTNKTNTNTNIATRRSM